MTRSSGATRRGLQQAEGPRPLPLHDDNRLLLFDYLIYLPLSSFTHFSPCIFIDLLHRELLRAIYLHQLVTEVTRAHHVPTIQTRPTCPTLPRRCSSRLHRFRRIYDCHRYRQQDITEDGEEECLIRKRRNENRCQGSEDRELRRPNTKVRPPALCLESRGIKLTNDA